MSKYRQKTNQNKMSVAVFLNAIKDNDRRRDAKQLLKLMKEITKQRPMMWGDSLIGFGRYDYTYASGHSGSWPLTAFAPRKDSLTVYIMPGFSEHGNSLKKLGPHRVGKSCLYIKELKDVHIPTLKKIIKDAYRYMEKKHSNA
jgi:hypothetical protein